MGYGIMGCKEKSGADDSSLLNVKSVCCFTYPAFQHSTIPSFQVPKEIASQKKNNNSSKLLQDIKVLIVNTSGDFFQEIFGLDQLS